MKARFLTIPDAVLCIITPELPERAYILGRCYKNIEQYRFVEWIPSMDPEFRPATQQDFEDFRVADDHYRTDPRYDFPMHPALEFFKQMNPQAEVECNNTRVYWTDEVGNSHSVTFFTDREKEFQEDLLNATAAKFNANILWLKHSNGWLRFVKQPKPL